METFQMSEEHEEPAAAANSRDLKKNPGGKLFPLLLLSFGFLCLLQSALNISLRLTSYCSCHPDKNLTGPDQNQTSQPAETPAARTARIQQMKRLFCVYGGEAENPEVDLRALPSSFKQQLATFCPSIYYISSTMTTWNKSRNYCLGRGADLVTINSREEQNFLRRLRHKVWIGLMKKAGEWEWVDGTRLNPSF
ncbi:NKG2-D type II integral membrane protein-like [Poeciliopsis prolifica]|uniref:NKG2-D type II integral membrane protein-like n=1 Tax=Poeciliopsis prolifica TaxID=188132 RepID=UPI0024142492|nr:NKG2-D type II integral membrane protein-like [Poeciliopsis prolifica]